MKRISAFVLSVAIILFSTLACCHALDITVDGYINGDEWYGKEKTFYYPCENDGLTEIESLIIGDDVNYARNEISSYFIAHAQSDVPLNSAQCGYITVNSQKIILCREVDVAEDYADFSVSVKWAKFTDLNQFGAEISVVFSAKIKKTAVDIRIQLCDRNGIWTDVYTVFSNTDGSVSVDEGLSKSNVQKESTTSSAVIKNTERAMNVRSYANKTTVDGELSEGETGRPSSVQADASVKSVIGAGSEYNYFFGNSSVNDLPKSSRVKYAVGTAVAATLILIAIIFAASGVKKAAQDGVNTDGRQECEKEEQA